MAIQNNIYNINTHTISQCNKCDISINRKSIVNGNGNTSKQGIMFIGEAPGYYEDKSGVPFVGNSGKLFNNILNLFGITRQDVYVTNIIKCRPPNNRSPLMREIKNCVPYLKAELFTIEPKIIVLLGNIALNVYFNKSNLKVSKFRGYIIPTKNTIVVPTYHPSYVLRNSDNRKLLYSYVNDFYNIAILYRQYINPFIQFKI